MIVETDRQIAPTEENAEQLDLCLRRAFEADLKAPLPAHLQRLVDALQSKFPRSTP